LEKCHGTLGQNDTFRLVLFCVATMSMLLSYTIMVKIAAIRSVFKTKIHQNAFAARDSAPDSAKRAKSAGEGNTPHILHPSLMLSSVNSQRL